jgi:hypothetical protein
VNCNYFIPNVIGQQAYWFIGKICIRLVAGSASVAVKRRAINRWRTAITSLYYWTEMGTGLIIGFFENLWLITDNKYTRKLVYTL